MITPTHKHTDALIAQGYPVVVGVDEVGRGALAGPVVVGAVILPPDLAIDGIRDSKMLSRKQRELASLNIKRLAFAVGIGWVSPALIDEKGLSWALTGAAKLALADMAYQYHAVLLDGGHNYLDSDAFVQTVVRGDSLCMNIAAAGIVAKVARDNYMHLQDQLYSAYGFNSHVGYGTASHLNAIDRFGATSLHRQLFLRKHLASHVN